MNKAIAALLLCLAWPVSAWDEYLPVEKGKFEIGAGYSFAQGFGHYDSAGTLDSTVGSPAFNTIPLRLKYGILPGLDVELAWTAYVSNKSAGDWGGFDRPELTLKYALTKIGAGVFVGMSLPLATGDLYDPLYNPREPAAGFAFGALYGGRFGALRVAAAIGNRVNSENDDGYKVGNQFCFLLKPEWMWSDFLGTYFLWKYEASGIEENPKTPNVEVPGTDRNLTTIAPGLSVRPYSWLSYEIAFPFTVAGKNGAFSPTFSRYYAPGATWGLSAAVRAVFPR